MHRATPLNVAYRAYSAGGTRGVIGEVNDTTQMQEVKANFMAGEQREKIEAPQNYGFSSVNMGPDDGGSAEHFSSFIGGSRAFPVAHIIDDRRHRLKGLDPGDVAMFRTKDDSQQFHLTKDGGFWSGPTDKKLRLQLVQKQQQQGQGGAQQLDTAGGGDAGSQQGQQSDKGQKSVYKNDSSQYIDLNGSMTEHVNKEHRLLLDDKDTAIQVHPSKKVYLGGLADKAMFLPVLLADGSPAFNTLARKGAIGREGSGPPTIIQTMMQEIAELKERIKVLETRLGS